MQLVMHDGIISMIAVESNRICLEAQGLHLTSRRKGYEISGDAREKYDSWYCSSGIVLISTTV